jgi:transposase-like protein
MKKCPHCADEKNQVKNGKTISGSQLYKCKICNRKYTPEPKYHGYDKAKREQAIRLVIDGSSQRQAARHVGVSHGTVANWFREYADNLPNGLPVPGGKVDVAEQDELFTFVGDKKTKPMS